MKGKLSGKSEVRVTGEKKECASPSPMCTFYLMLLLLSGKAVTMAQISRVHRGYGP